jgi:hypothetical protein
MNGLRAADPFTPMDQTIRTAPQTSFARRSIRRGRRRNKNDSRVSRSAGTGALTVDVKLAPRLQAPARVDLRVFTTQPRPLPSNVSAFLLGHANTNGHAKKITTPAPARVLEQHFL